MIDILFKTSISGGLAFLLWVISYPFSRRIFNSYWHYSLLKFSMFVFGFPLCLLIPISNKIFDTLQSTDSALQIGTVTDIIPSVSIIPPLPQKINVSYLMIIWLFVALILSLVEINKVLRLHKSIILSSDDVVSDEEFYDLFLQCKEHIGIVKKVEFRISKYIKTPFTAGLINPVIVMPSSGMNLEEKKLSLIHEFTHIKNGDLWFKFFSVIIVIIHWFNPMAHFLRIKICAVSELYCDECVTKEMSKKERIEYGKLLLKTAYGNNPTDAGLYSPLSTSTAKMKIRLEGILKSRETCGNVRILSASVFFFICLFVSAQSIAPSREISGKNEYSASYYQRFVPIDDDFIQPDWNYIPTKSSRKMTDSEYEQAIMDLAIREALLGITDITSERRKLQSEYTSMASPDRKTAYEISMEKTDGKMNTSYSFFDGDGNNLMSYSDLSVSWIVFSTEAENVRLIKFNNIYKETYMQNLIPESEIISYELPQINNKKKMIG